MKMQMFFDMKNLSIFKYRKIISEDNKILEKIIKTNLEKFNLDIPGTAYFDESLKNMSEFYLQSPLKRAYYVLLSEGKIMVVSVSLNLKTLIIAVNCRNCI